MTQPKFTPGPWMAEVHEIGVDDPRLFGTITDSNGNDVDYISLRQEAVHANATLIAAAPDMYAALEFIVDREDFTFAECSLAEEIVLRAKIALTKAGRA